MDTKTKALAQMEELQQQLELLNYKEQFYLDLINNNQKDSWNPMNNVKQEKTAV